MIRVVLADDEAPAREKLAHWLSEQPDMTVVGSAEDGLSASQCIERFQPDVAFLDVQMPTLSGLQVAAQLEPSSAPLIVFVTAFDEHAVKAFDLNAIDYLLKPYDRDRLARTVQRVRERLQAHQSGAAAVAIGRERSPSCERLLVPDGHGGAEARAITRRFRTFRATEIALYHALGKLPEPTLAHRSC